MKTDSLIVLIVEDNPADAALITEELSGATGRGVFELVYAASLADAQQRLDDVEAAAVLLDLSLPDSLGLETFKSVAQHSPHLPVVVLTGLDDHELGIRAVSSGAQDYLIKGKIDSATLERTLHFAIGRKRRETEVRQQQSLDVMAQFAEGIAHQFNSLLQVVLGQLQSLEWPLRENPEALGQLRKSSQTVLGGAELTRRLLAVTGRLPDRPGLLDANAHIARLGASLRKSAATTTRINTELSADAWQVFADPARLDMTLLTLVNNASEAMLGLGEVTIRTSNLSVSQPNAADLPGGDYLMIEIVDIGEGLAPDDAKLRKDPFYDEHANPRLNGLGLNVTQNFIHASGGHVAVRTQPGHGTTVRLYLPRAEHEVLAGPGRSVAAKRNDRKRQHVMVVDEDADMRQAMVAYLSQLGYQAIEAASAADALALMDGSTQVELVIVDRRGASSVPGDQLVNKLALLQPNLKVLYLTNADGQKQPDFALPPECVAALARPASIEAMADRLNHLLGQQGLAA